MLARTSMMFVRTAFSSAPRNYLKRFRESVHWTFVGKHQAEGAGYFLYETSVDKVDCAFWVKHLGLGDSYWSWFVITELHVWMCAQRAMDDGYKERGLAVRNEMIKKMWVDCALRMQKLGNIGAKKRQESIFELADHFRLVMFIFDEGFNKDDQALACALWRVMFGRDPDFTDFHHLRTLVHYVRSNVDLLDSVSINQLHQPDSFVWRPLQDSVKATSGSPTAISSLRFSPLDVGRGELNILPNEIGTAQYRGPRTIFRANVV